MVCYGGVHVFGYNSAEGELIWMKSGALRVHCQGLALADFGCDPNSSESWRSRRSFVFFCQVSNTQFHRFPDGQISWNLNTTRQSVSWWKRSKQNFQTLPQGVISLPQNILTSCDFRPP